MLSSLTICVGLIMPPLLDAFGPLGLVPALLFGAATACLQLWEHLSHARMKHHQARVAKAQADAEIAEWDRLAHRSRNGAAASGRGALVPFFGPRLK